MRRVLLFRRQESAVTQKQFSIYYEANASGAERRLMLRGFKPEVAKDAVQDAALAMLERIETFPSASTGACLYAIAFRFATKEVGTPASKGRLSRAIELPWGGMSELEVAESVSRFGDVKGGQDRPPLHESLADRPVSSGRPFIPRSASRVRQ
jgi:hypothetical protein